MQSNQKCIYDNFVVYKQKKSKTCCTFWHMVWNENLWKYFTHIQTWSIFGDERRLIHLNVENWLLNRNICRENICLERQD